MNPTQHLSPISRFLTSPISRFLSEPKFVHLLVLTSLAITQPMLKILREHSIFFIMHSATQWQVIATVAIVSLAPAVCLYIMILVVHTVSDVSGKWLFFLVMSMLSIFFVLQVINVLSWSEYILIDISAVFGIGIMVLYSISRSVRSAVSVLSVFPVAIVVFFLFDSPFGASAYSPGMKAVALDDLLETDSAAYISEHENTEASDQSVSMIKSLNDQFPPIYILVFDELPQASLLDEKRRY